MGWGWVALVARVTKCRPVVTGTTETKCNKPLSLVALRPRGGGGVWNTKLSCMERCARKKILSPRIRFAVQGNKWTVIPPDPGKFKRENLSTSRYVQWELLLSGGHEQGVNIDSWLLMAKSPIAKAER